jgi:hypothetical protein
MQVTEENQLMFTTMSLRTDLPYFIRRRIRIGYIFPIAMRVWGTWHFVWLKTGDKA